MQATFNFGDRRHKVSEGDTYWNIAQKFGLDDVSALVEANGGDDLLHPGMTVRVPRQLFWKPLCGRVTLPPPAHNPRPFFGCFYNTNDVAHYQKHPEVRRFLKALHMVEASGKLPAPVGDNGESIGPLQISKWYHEDAWERSAAHEQASSSPAQADQYHRCEELSYAEQTALRYFLRWCPDALMFRDYQTMARTHNGGPSHHRAARATAHYWRKVHRFIDEDGNKRRSGVTFDEQPIPKLLLQVPLL
ncbi:hypothetical protein WJX72_010500 [[Myrmecia] bisecta]|uniref:lysozyme n=1 Tax=[Myrmecia] bisecta TaxID=41462 RepID=A0AAW1QGA0_9CHLO